MRLSWTKGRMPRGEAWTSPSTPRSPARASRKRSRGSTKRLRPTRTGTTGDACEFIGRMRTLLPVAPDIVDDHKAVDNWRALHVNSPTMGDTRPVARSEEHTSELQSRGLIS